MKKQFLALAVLTAIAAGAYAQATDTISQGQGLGRNHHGRA